MKKIHKDRRPKNAGNADGLQRMQSKLMPVLFLILTPALMLTACTQKDEGAQMNAAQAESSHAAHSQKYLDIITELENSKKDNFKPGNTSQTADSQSHARDVNRQFVEVMLSHQQAAVMMAYTELKHGKDPDARNIAQRSIDIQQVQMNWMNQWLASYTPDASDDEALDDGIELDVSDSEHHQKMIHAAQENSPDKAFVELMHLHQNQAMVMASQAKNLTLNTEVRALADDIFDTQSAQTKQMQAWLSEQKD